MDGSRSTKPQSDLANTYLECTLEFKPKLPSRKTIFILGLCVLTLFNFMEKGTASAKVV